MSDHKDMTHRHLRHKLQSLGRRLDELEEATHKRQKSEDELLDLQDKIIQAEGSNSSLLGDVEALRKRLLKIQGKDEEVRKAEDLCRTVREKLEEEENLTKELKGEIEHLQRRMAELEKLEEAFAKSKSDCSQLCLSLNEEKNLTKKLSSELDSLKARVKEVEGSETKLDKAEQALTNELERLKAFTQTFVAERKRFLEKQREDEKTIQKLSEERKKLLGMTTESREDLMSSRIEDELFTSKLAAKKNLQYLKLADEKLGIVGMSEFKKGGSFDGSQEEDNKVKELAQEVEKLKNRLKQLEVVEEDLKSSQFKNGELHEKFQTEQKRACQLSEQVEQLRTQLYGKAGVGGKAIGSNGNPQRILENGKAESEEMVSAVAFRHEKPKFKTSAAFPEPSSPKHRRENKLSKDFGRSEQSSPKTVRRALSPSLRTRRTAKTPTGTISSDNGVTSRFPEERPKGASYVANSASDVKKASVLSRYPPAANEQKPLRTQFRQTDRERVSRPCAGSDSESNHSDAVLESSASAQDKEAPSASDQDPGDTVQESVSSSSANKANGSYAAYRSQCFSLLAGDNGSDSQSSASETESTGSRPSEREAATETISGSVSSRAETPRYSRYPRVHDVQSDGSSSRSSFDEEPHSRARPADGGRHPSAHAPPPSLEIQRVCSPREALRSKGVIKPAIVEIDRKEVMISDSSSMTNGKPRISTKPVVSSTSSKITSSITIYPSDASSSRTSSRSSSLSSEPFIGKERHLSTSNILIGPSSEHRASVSVPYEISIPKSEISLQQNHDPDWGDNERCGGSGRRPFAGLNDAESGFESGGGATTISSTRTQRRSEDGSSSDARNVTVRSTWRNEADRGRPGSKASMDGGSDDDAEAAITWRAYRATTFDSDDGVGSSARLQKATKPAEVYMRRFNSATSTKDEDEPMLRSDSPSLEVLGRSVPHAPVTSQSWSRSHSQQPLAKDNQDPAPSPCLSPASWRRQRHQDPAPSPCLSPASWRRQRHLGGSNDHPAKSRGGGSGGRSWSHSQSEPR